MKIQAGTIHEEFSRDTYWARIRFESDDGSKKSTVITCASHEYLWDKLGVRDLSKEDLKGWLNAVVEKWKNKGDSILKEAVHFDIYANTEEGIENGLIFLRTITP